MNNKTKIMKRKGLSRIRIITACIIAVGVGSLFSGCGSTAASNSTNTAKNTTAQTTKANNTSDNNTATDNSSNNSGQTNDTNSSQQNNTSNTTSKTTSTKKQTSTTTNSNPIVYYVKGSKVYHLSKTDTALKNSKNILSTTLKKAKAAGMHQSTSNAI